MWKPLAAVVAIALLGAQQPKDLASYVNPLIGTANGGNTFPGAVLPFGMFSWSPENTRGDMTRAAAPGGYHHDVMRIRGFSLTHLSGTGCRGASGDIPFFPHVGEVATSPSADAKNTIYASDFSHDDERAIAGSYRVRLQSGVIVELTAALRSGIGRFVYPAGQPATMLVRTSDTQIGSSDASVTIDAATRTISGSVTSGNFCGYLERGRPAQLLHAALRRDLRSALHVVRHMAGRSSRGGVRDRIRGHVLRHRRLSTRREGLGCVRRIRTRKHRERPRRHLLRQSRQRAREPVGGTACERHG